MKDILNDLKDLHKQATEENSHYYTAKVIKRAISEIEQLRQHTFTYSEVENIFKKCTEEAWKIKNDRK